MRLSSAMSKFFLLTVAASWMWVAACSPGGTSTATTCELDTECPTGSLCVDGFCAIQSCETSGECPTGLCNGGVCMAAQCDCAGCPDCPAGSTCSGGFCVQEGGTEACLVPSECGPGQTCEDGLCVPCPDGVCAESLPCDPACEDGWICDDSTGECLAIPTGGSALCGPCATSDDCGESWTCATLANGLSCLPPCGTHNECETGFSCSSGFCAPTSNSCGGCAMTGCDDGEACNPDGACVSASSWCDGCNAHWECGEGSACIAYGGTKICAPRCVDSPCMQGSSCSMDQASQLEVCLYDGAECCYSVDPVDCMGDPEACDPACGGATPICSQGTCVQCLTSSDCADGETCNTTSNTCIPDAQECTGGTPFYDATTGQCVECLVNADCTDSSLPSCDPNSKTCVGDVCQTCADPYPACAMLGDAFYCVQCTDDSYCVGGTCNTDTYTCEGGVVSGSDAACSSDADCDAGITEYDLACDTSTGLCYDMNGQCDNVTAFCIGGNDCVSLIEQLLGSAGGSGGFPSIPGLPGMGSGSTLGGGACACEPDNPGNPLDSSSSDCPPGLMCGGLADLLAGLGGGGGSSGSKVCFDMGSLFPF